MKLNENVELLNVLADVQKKFIYETRKHPDVDRFLKSHPPANYEQHLAFMENNAHRFRILTTKVHGTFLGYCQISEIDPPNLVELGFVIHPDHQGLGFGKDLVNHTLNLIKDDFRFAILYVLKTNPLAIHLYETCGFNKVGLSGEIYMMGRHL